MLRLEVSHYTYVFEGLLQHGYSIEVNGNSQITVCVWQMAGSDIHFTHDPSNPPLIRSVGSVCP